MLNKLTGWVHKTAPNERGTIEAGSTGVHDRGWTVTAEVYTRRIAECSAIASSAVWGRKLVWRPRPGALDGVWRAV